MSLTPTTVFRGTDCELFMEGEWQANISEVDATVNIDQAELTLLGNYWTNYRTTGLKGSGSTKGVFVNTVLLEKLAAIQNGQEYRTEIIIKNINPDTGATYRVRLKNVVFNTIPLAAFQAAQIASQDLSFTFSGFEFLDTVA